MRAETREHLEHNADPLLGTKLRLGGNVSRGASGLPAMLPGCGGYLRNALKAGVLAFIVERVQYLT